jgi:hypothetical protein
VDGPRVEALALDHLLPPKLERDDQLEMTGHEAAVSGVLVPIFGETLVIDLYQTN